MPLHRAKAALRSRVINVRVLERGLVLRLARYLRCSSALLLLSAGAIDTHLPRHLDQGSLHHQAQQQPPDLWTAAARQRMRHGCDALRASTFARSHGSHIASSSLARAARILEAFTVIIFFDGRWFPWLELPSIRAYASSFARLTWEARCQSV